MIRRRKVTTVAKFEFISTVKRKGYLITTLGMPVFLLLYLGVVGVVQGSFVEKKQRELKVYGVIDKASVLRLEGDTAAPIPELPEQARALLSASGQAEAATAALVRDNAVFRPFPDEPAARAALAADKIAGFYVIDENYLDSGIVDSYLEQAPGLSMRGARDQLGELLVQRLLAGRVEERVTRLVKEPIRDGKAFAITPEGETRPRDRVGDAARILLPIVFGMLMFISLMGSAGYLMQAVATEKENKVFEVLLASANPDEILTGKLIGLGAAGLIQVAVWFSMAGVGGLATAALMTVSGIEIPWLAMALGFVYFVLGYLLVGTLIIGSASLGGNMKEAQQYSMVWTLTIVLPLVLFMVFMTEPHGLFPRILSYIPFTSALSMVMRLSFDARGVPWWEIALTLAILLVSIRLAINVGARLFRVGLLLSGAPPKIREVLRQAGLTPGSARARPAAGGAGTSS